jgi:hypothetical protein
MRRTLSKSSAARSGPARSVLGVQRAAQVATVRFETAPGEQMQVDVGQRLVSIVGQQVRIFFVCAVLGRGGSSCERFSARARMTGARERRRIPVLRRRAAYAAHRQ